MELLIKIYFKNKQILQKILSGTILYVYPSKYFQYIKNFQ